MMDETAEVRLAENAVGKDVATRGSTAVNSAIDYGLTPGANRK
jgi:hypothetical protein